MKLKQSISLIILSLSAPTLFGQAKSNDRGKVMEAVVAKYDTNKDGQLDEKERAVILKAFDLDGSGDLDKNEKRAVAKAVSGQPKPPVPSQPKPEQEETPAVSKWTTPGFQRANTLGGGKADVPNAGVFRVFVLMGQSNMVGAAKASNLESPYTDKNDRIRVWANGRWEYLVPRQKFGPEVSLAHQLADHWPDDTIGIIKVAVGGTGISAFAKKWSEERANRTFDGKKGPLYQDMINAVTEAKKNPRTEFTGFVWKQGGADGNRKDTAYEYFDNLQQLISDIRKDVGEPDLPAFVLTYLSDEELNKLSADTFGKRAHIGTVMKAQNQAARDIPNTVTVHHGKLPLVDAVHFNHEGQVTLGKMTADAVEAFYKSNKPLPRKEAALPMTQDHGSHGLAQEQIDSLAENFRKAVEKQAVAGCAFLIAHKGEIVFREAFGYANLELKRPFTTDELIPIASVSKPLAASVIMALVEQEKLKLDDPVAQYLPEFKGIKIEGTETAAGPITIRHLLSHTAGFWGNKNITPEKVALIRNFERPLAEAVSEMATYELLSEPGTKYQYSGAGYCVAGRVAEVALNQSFEEISQNALFRPLGMSRTTFLPSQEIRQTVPTAYQKKDGKLQKTLSVSNVEDLQFILPGGSLFTTMDELAVFGQMQLNNGKLNGKRILSEESIAEMRRLQTPQKGPKTYGLGWFRDEVTDSDLADVTYHNGALGAHLRIDRRREMVTVFFVHQTAGPFAELLNRRNQFVNEMFPIPDDH